ncbi:hypothetical protein MUK42_35294 [Musa troglodytarum]|uniref:Uncharacterized protein n=1 Tax=Musa troglodytarum TaxID=320322 RepID=A0A9E7HH28_9LILI|nr:hypothetical protein MUK42_35294 [Musa troglodytarum]
MRPSSPCSTTKKMVHPLSSKRWWERWRTRTQIRELPIVTIEILAKAKNDDWGRIEWLLLLRSMMTTSHYCLC